MRTRRQRGGVKFTSGSPKTAAGQTRTGRTVKAPKPSNWNVPSQTFQMKRPKSHFTGKPRAKTPAKTQSKGLFTAKRAKGKTALKTSSVLRVLNTKKKRDIASVIGAPKLTAAQRSKLLSSHHSRQGFHAFEPMKAGLKSMVLKVAELSGFTIKSGKRSSKAARRAIDPLGAEVQCAKVIGKPKAGEKCWICGYKIDTTAGKDSKIGPVCEHVLPAFAANMYLDLIRSARQDISDAHKLEYRWAHILCNNQKSDEFLIQLKDGRFEPDEFNCRVLLNNIIFNFKGEVNIDIDKQVKDMVDTTLQPLCDFLNKAFAGQHRMVMLGGVGKLVDILEKQQGKRAARAALQGTAIGEQLNRVMEDSDENTNMSSESDNSRSGSRSGSRNRRSRSSGSRVSGSRGSHGSRGSMQSGSSRK